MDHNTILIIDDDKITTSVIEEYLTNFGFKVITAKNRDTGIEKMRSNKPDLILLDIMLPDVDGIKILKEIKLTPGFLNIPILLLSAIDRTNIKVKGFQLGADDYITKPVDKAELLARIQVAIKRAVRAKNDTGILEGNLSDFSISDLLQSFELGKKSGKISLPDIDGEIIINNGVITNSRQGNFYSDKGINRIFFLEKGSFIVNFKNLDEKAEGEKINIMNSLLSNISYIDEVNSMLKTLSRHIKGIKDLDKLKELTNIEPSISVNKTDIKDIIAKMNDNLKDNIQKLTKIYKDFPSIFDTKT